MHAKVTRQPLTISCVFSDGSTGVFSVSDSPGPELVFDLLTGLSELIHPHGTVDAAGSVKLMVQAAKGMAGTFAALGFTGGATDLRRTQVTQFWLGCTSAREAQTRRMLLGYDTATGRLDAKVRELAAGRAYNPQRWRGVLPPYPETEWDRLIKTCRQIVDEAYDRHRRSLAAAATADDPKVKGWTPANLCWLVARTGPATAAGFGWRVGISAQTVRLRGGFYEATTSLFPHMDVVIAYRLLFGAYTGIVPDGITDLVTDDIDWAGDATVLLRYVKGRTATESLNLPKRAVRLLEQWLSHSSLLRGFTSGQVSRQLWIGLAARGSSAVFTGAPDRVVVQRWVASHGLTGDDGKPFKVHRSRIRTTHQSMRDKGSWAGRSRATIDPNHTAQVEGDNYLSATTPAQRRAMEAIVEDAQHDLLRRGQPPTILSEADTVALARDYPQIVEALRLDGEVIEELVGGRRDVFVAACVDQLAGLHGPKGQPCPARPWVCLLCPLAVFAPRHAVNLLRLKAFFTRQWQQMPASQFMAVFGPYSQRISEILDRFDPKLLGEAARDVAGNDHELPLRPEETTR